MVDKNLLKPIKYVTIAKDKLDDLSECLFYSNKTCLLNKYIYGELTTFVSLSKEQKLTSLNIKINHQFIGICLISEIEATLKTALFNCKIDIFEYQHAQSVISPKWGSIFTLHTTLEMRKRFLVALKTNHPEFNEKLDYLFNTYYVNRKNNLKKQN